MHSWFKNVTEVLRIWQTWFVAVTVTIPTVYTFITAKAEGVPPYLLTIYTGQALTFFAALALLVWVMSDRVQERIGPRRQVRKTQSILSDLAKRRHTDIGLPILAEYWSGHTHTGGHESWAKWNVRFRDLKDATNDGLLITSSPLPLQNGMKTSVTIESAIRFFESGEWHKFG